MPQTFYDSVGNHYSGPLRAAYVNGLYANVTAAKAGGGQVLLQIDVSGAGVGNCLDVENGDATPASAPGWVRRRIAAGVAKPWLYCNRSTWPAVIDAVKAAGITTGAVFWWIADYTNSPHFPELDGVTADACQYGGGVTAAFDISCVRDGIFNAPVQAATPTLPAPPAPPAAAVPTEQENNMVAHDLISGGFWVARPDGSVEAFDGAPYLGGLNNHPEWKAGTASGGAPCVGIAPFGVGGAGGYVLVADSGTGVASPYRMPRDGSLKGS